MTVHSVLDDMPARLRANGDNVRTTWQAWKAAILQRNQCVVEAIDGGMPQGTVATYVGVKQPQIVKILARPLDISIA